MVVFLFPAYHLFLGMSMKRLYMFKVILFSPDDTVFSHQFLSNRMYLLLLRVVNDSFSTIGSSRSFKNIVKVLLKKLSILYSIIGENFKHP